MVHNQGMVDRKESEATFGLARCPAAAGCCTFCLLSARTTNAPSKLSKGHVLQPVLTLRSVVRKQLLVEAVAHGRRLVPAEHTQPMRAHQSQRIKKKRRLTF